MKLPKFDGGMDFNGGFGHNSLMRPPVNNPGSPSRVETFLPDAPGFDKFIRRQSVAKPSSTRVDMSKTRSQMRKQDWNAFEKDYYKDAKDRMITPSSRLGKKPLGRPTV